MISTAVPFVRERVRWVPVLERHEVALVLASARATSIAPFVPLSPGE